MNPGDLMTTTLLLFALAGWLAFAAMAMTYRAMRGIAQERTAEVRRLRASYEDRLAVLRAEREERLERVHEEARRVIAPARYGGVSRW